MHVSTHSQVLGLIRSHSPISQSDIRVATGLSASAVSGTVKRAIMLGLVQEVGLNQKSMGRPHSMLSLNADYGHAIGVQLNSNHNQMVLTNLWGEVILSEEMHLSSFGPSDVVEAIAAFAERVQAKPGLVERLVGVGIGLSGIVDPHSGVCLDSTTLLKWHNVPIAQLVEARTHLPTTIENDANALALAELSFGTHRPHESFVMVTLGNGIGAGLILEGRVHRGRNGLAGEIGHTRVTSESGFPCHCGKNGCLEAVASRATLVRRVSELTGQSVTVDGLKAAVAAGGAQVLEGAGQMLGAALANLATTFDPDAVYLAFDPDLNIPELIHATRDSFAANLLPILRSRPELRLLIDSGTMWARGASSIAIERFFEATALELASIAFPIGGFPAQTLLHS